MASKDVKLSKSQNMSMVFSCVFRVENASVFLPRIIYDHQHIINIYVCIYIYTYTCIHIYIHMYMYIYMLYVICICTCIHLMDLYPFIYLSVVDVSIVYNGFEVSMLAMGWCQQSSDFQDDQDGYSMGSWLVVDLPL